MGIKTIVEIKHVKNNDPTLEIKRVNNSDEIQSQCYINHRTSDETLEIQVWNRDYWETRFDCNSIILDKKAIIQLYEMLGETLDI